MGIAGASAFSCSLHLGPMVPTRIATPLRMTPKDSATQTDSTLQSVSDTKLDELANTVENLDAAVDSMVCKVRINRFSRSLANPPCDSTQRIIEEK